ncbi:SGNH/GDSL hydrolase family protein [Magnetospirillum sp. UT-4]|uniref:SGNH/GDSL hydrolase family protein n=1 Tax=Magnetospirillum sp. UT-4 TaxID=2681467 RepID=UPI0013834F79|nr:SGNH/GDSL hydrolase family protein [Magnetospirillum sp. UT-4]CAA7612124.1 exported hypothetical protein [Magnetospirillum sp. UT-4]
MKKRGSGGHLAAYLIVTALACMAGFAGFELYVRYDLSRYHSGRSQANMMVAYTEPLYSVPAGDGAVRISLGPFWGRSAEWAASRPSLGPFNPSLEVENFIYDAEDTLRLNVKVRTNNLGFLSDLPYDLSSPGDEYRIVVLGDSMTGTTTMPYQWVDEVQTLLDADEDLKGALGRRKIRLYNLGIPGAGFPHFAEGLGWYGAEIKPDLVVVNFTLGTMPRKTVITTANGDMVIPGLVSYRIGTELVRVYVSCLSEPISLSSDACWHYNWYFAPAKVIRDPVLRAEMRALVGNDMVKGRVWSSMRSLALDRLLGRDDHMYNWRVPTQSKMDESERQTIVAHVAAEMNRIAESHPNVLPVLMPLYWDMVPERIDYVLPRMLAERDPRFDAVMMRAAMPEAGPEEIASWYNVPHDGHLSAKGGHIYAKAMARAIVEHLGRQGVIPPPPTPHLPLVSAGQK